MIRNTTQLIAKNIDGLRADYTVREVSTYHRIQASPGFRAAANHCAAKLNSQGIRAEILSYPATEDTVFGIYPCFQEWECKDGWCELVDEDRVIADFKRDNICVIQKSIGCDYRDQPLDIVELPEGTKEADCADMDLAGKLIYIHENINDYHWAINNKGALGFITDFVLIDEGVRGRIEQGDTMRYTSFWWEKSMKKCFGYVLTPREGDRLTALCRKLAAEGKYPKARCYMDARLYDGHIENVTAFLPGETDEEILIEAHLCHPRASANDNASGVAATMEAMLTLKNLIAAGKLAPLKRGIRLLLIPEFTGTHAFFATIGDQRKKILCGINLDMVGGRQLAGYGPLTVTEPPRAMATFAGDLTALILDELKRQIPSHNKIHKVPLFNSTVVPYGGGSDHAVTSDPVCGVPSCMIGQWPDKYYHTNSDTTEVIDPAILHKSASIAAAFSYIAANLDVEDVPVIMNRSLVRMTELIGEYNEQVRAGVMDEVRFGRSVELLRDYYMDSCDDYLRFFHGEDLEKVKGLIEEQKKNIAATAAAVARLGAGKDLEAGSNPFTDEKYQYVPSRTYIGQASGSYFSRIPGGAKIYADYLKSVSGKSNSHFEMLIQFYINGRNTLAQIAEKAICEAQFGDVETVDAFVNVLCGMGLVKKN